MSKQRKSKQPQRELTTREVSELLKVTPSRIRTMVADGRLIPVRSLSGSGRANYQNFFAEADVLKLAAAVTADPRTALGREQDHHDETLDWLQRACKRGGHVVAARDAQTLGCCVPTLTRRLRRLVDAGLATVEKSGREMRYRPV